MHILNVSVQFRSEGRGGIYRDTPVRILLWHQGSKSTNIICLIHTVFSKFMLKINEQNHTEFTFKISKVLNIDESSLSDIPFYVMYLIVKRLYCIYHHLFHSSYILWGISSVCNGMNNISTTFMNLHFDCLQLCVYFLFIIFFLCVNVSNKNRQKVAVSMAWNVEPCTGKTVQKSCVTLAMGRWKEVEVRTGLLSELQMKCWKIYVARNLNMRGRMKLFIFAVHETNRETCTDDWTIKKNCFTQRIERSASTDWIDGQKK